MTVIDTFMRGNASTFIPEPLPTIGIITACHTYTHFLEQWCAGVRGLNTQPDQIVIAATDPLEVIKAVDSKIQHYEVICPHTDFGLGAYLNAAVRACETDWIVWIGVDDRYRPHALDGLRFVTADVRAMGMQYGAGHYWIPPAVDAEQILMVNENLIPCGSAFRRDLWKKQPFNPEMAPFEDWALWVGFAALGASFSTTARVDFDYAQHPDQIVPPTEPTRSRIREWSKTLLTNHS